MGFFLRDGITPNLIRLGESSKDRVRDVMEQYAPQVQGSAQDNAPWADRTGQARASLNADVSAGDDITLELSHGVDYGEWLEVIQNGRYAIIMPTLESYAQEIFQAAGARWMGQE